MNVARRFSVAYLALAALLGVAIGTLVVLVERPAPTPPPPWSPWQPNEASRVARQQQIASHVGSQYYLSGGKRLVRVVVRDPDASPNPIRDVAVARNLDPKQQSDVLGVVDSTKTAMYILCGDGPHCAIKEGKPSVARGTVLRREALELALYTFRYRDDVDMVVALLPPPPPDKNTAATTTANQQTQALFFRPGDLRGELATPLATTIPKRTPRPETLALNGPEAQRIDAITRPNLFLASFQLGQDSHAFLVLDRPPR